MRAKLTCCLLLLCILFCNYPCISQDSTSIQSLASLPGKYYTGVTQKLSGFETRFDKATRKYLRKLKRQEQKIYSKLSKKDPIKAKELFGDISARYNNLSGQASARTNHLDKFSQVYSSKLDSLETAISFLQKNQVLQPGTQTLAGKTLEKVNDLKSKLNQTDQLKKLLEERKKYLIAQLDELGMIKELKGFKKELFYYQQQIREYKELLNDPAKLEGKLLEAVAQIPAFRKFFNTNSALAGLFRLPASPDQSTVDLTGLQTRTSVMQDIQSRFGSDPSVQRSIRQNMQQAQDQMSQLRNQANQRLQSGSNELNDLPGFKPNNQKTKSFLQRLELGTNIQSQKSNNFFPVTSDIGISLGYKLNDKSIVGLGASYKIGWGQNIRNINITHQGMGLRSFVDWKIKGSFWISGGYEMNYKAEFSRIEILKDLNAWQQSGLIGLSKLVSLKTKFFKNTKLQLLWDFMSYQQTPKTQSVLFRVGYNIK
jgi:hypothetical protein